MIHEPVKIYSFLLLFSKIQYNMTGDHGKKDVNGYNSMRLAEVWMDDYKRFYYMHRSELIVSIKPKSFPLLYKRIRKKFY